MLRSRAQAGRQGMSISMRAAVVCILASSCCAIAGSVTDVSATATTATGRHLASPGRKLHGLFDFLRRQAEPPAEEAPPPSPPTTTEPEVPVSPPPSPPSTPPPPSSASSGSPSPSPFFPTSSPFPGNSPSPAESPSPSPSSSPSPDANGSPAPAEPYPDEGPFPPEDPAKFTSTCVGGLDDDVWETGCHGVDRPETAIDKKSARVSTLEYNPSNVDWRSLVKSIKFLAKREPRFCNFAIRSHFHDAGSYTTERGNSVARRSKASGSDGSFLLDKHEFLQPENRYDAFGLFTRTALIELSKFYTASFADMLNVAAFTCVEALGGVVDIPSQCEKDGIPLYVGKLDADLPFSKKSARDRVNHLPGPFNEMPFWLNFWLKDLNSVAAGEKWKFTAGEGLALMGSHTLIDNQADTRKGKDKRSADRQDIRGPWCSGEDTQRMFTWDNSYFHDVSSGTCVPRGPNPKNAQWFVTSLSGTKGRQPNEDEDEDLTKATFKSYQGRKLDLDLECQAKREARGLGIGTIPEDNDFRFVDWTPDDSRWPCCGHHCFTCTGKETGDDEPYYCVDSPKGTSFWFYTWQDCDLIYSTRTPIDQYCGKGDKDCSLFKGDRSEMVSELKKLGEAYAAFRNSNQRWQEEYARGHCKLNHLGAQYGPNTVPLAPLLNTCFKPDGDDCDTDPSSHGNVRKDKDCCKYRCPSFDLKDIIDSDQSGCGDCDPEDLEPPEVPEQGTLPTNTELPGKDTFVPDVEE